MTLNWRAALAVSALFAMTSNASADPSAYTFDPMHTEVRFCWNHLGISRQCAHLTGYDGELLYDEANPEKSQFKVTFKTDSIETLVPIFNEHMKGDKLFDTKKFPRSDFQEHEIRADERENRESYRGFDGSWSNKTGYSRCDAQFCGHSANVEKADAWGGRYDERETNRFRRLCSRPLCF